MDTADIRKWYSRLAKEFAEGPFEDALGALPRTGKEILCLRSAPVPHRLPAGQSRNACRYAGEIQPCFGGGKGHLLRVRTDSTDPKLGKEALQMEAYCLLALMRPAEALDLLEEDPPGIGPR